MPNYITNISADSFLNAIIPNFPGIEKNVIDIRTPEEYDKGHINGSMNIDIMDISFQEEFEKLNKETAYYVISNNNKRAVIAKMILDEMRFVAIHDIKGGYKEWKGEMVVSDKKELDIKDNVRHNR